MHIFGQHFTENPLFFSNEILAIIMSIPPTFPFFFYDIGFNTLSNQGTFTPVGAQGGVLGTQA